MNRTTSTHEIAVPKWGGSNLASSEYHTSAKLREAATPLDATQWEPALILNLTGTPRTAAWQMDTAELSVAFGANHASRILDDTFLDGAVDAMFQDIVSLSRPKRAGPDIRKFRAKF